MAQMSHRLKPMEASPLSPDNYQLIKPLSMVLAAFGGGHLLHTLQTQSISIQIVAATDLDAQARSLFQELMHVPRIFSSATALYNWICSTDKTYLDVYISHTPVSVSVEFLHCWWEFHAKIIHKAQVFKSLQIL